MDQNNQYNNPMVEEEEGLDIMALVRSLWDGRKTILIVTGIFIVLGLVAAITMKRTYTVSTTMVPQMSSSRSSSLASLASLAGMDLGMTQTSELSPTGWSSCTPRSILRRPIQQCRSLPTLRII